MLLCEVLILTFGLEGEAWLARHIYSVCIFTHLGTGDGYLLSYCMNIGRGSFIWVTEEEQQLLMAAVTMFS